MTKSMLFASLCFIASAALFSCKKASFVPYTADGSKTNSIGPVSDDTQYLQNELDTGNVTLIAGKTYHVTGLNISYSLNMNGATINLTSTKNVAAITMRSPGASVTNGTIKGAWDNTTAGDPNGYSGIYIIADNCSVSRVNISSFSAYGITVGAVNGPAVTYCNISNTGYIGYFYDSETSTTKGGVFSNNTVDRSMLPPSTIQQMAIGIRGSLFNKNITTSDWRVLNNVIKLPAMPASLSAAGMEIRYCNNTLIANNTITGGSIGISMVECMGDTIKTNNSSNVSQEGIEYADCQNVLGWNNVISGSAAVGELVDGSAGGNNIQILDDNISGTARECIQAYYNTQNLTITGCTLSVSGNKAYGINLQRTSQVRVLNTNINGNGAGIAAIQLDNCPGNLTLAGGTVSNFQVSVIYIYNSTQGLITNNISMSNVSTTAVPRALAVVLDNGGLLGTNISVVL